MQKEEEPRARELLDYLNACDEVDAAESGEFGNGDGYASCR